MKEERKRRKKVLKRYLIEAKQSRMKAKGGLNVQEKKRKKIVFERHPS